MTDICPMKNSAVNDEQEELLRRYCREAEEKIAGAKDAATAVRLKEEVCREFKRECASDLVINATRAYLDLIIAERWGTGKGTDNRGNRGEN